jgi:hypothetical protein
VVNDINAIAAPSLVPARQSQRVLEQHERQERQPQPQAEAQPQTQPQPMAAAGARGVVLPLGVSAWAPMMVPNGMLPAGSAAQGAPLNPNIILNTATLQQQVFFNWSQSQQRPP